MLMPEPLFAAPELAATLLVAVELQMLVAVVPELLPEMLNGVLEPEVTPRLR